MSSLPDKEENVFLKQYILQINQCLYSVCDVAFVCVLQCFSPPFLSLSPSCMYVLHMSTEQMFRQTCCCFHCQRTAARHKHTDTDIKSHTHIWNTQKNGIGLTAILQHTRMTFCPDPACCFGSISLNNIPLAAETSSGRKNSAEIL